MLRLPTEAEMRVVAKSSRLSISVRLRSRHSPMCVATSPLVRDEVASERPGLTTTVDCVCAVVVLLLGFVAVVLVVLLVLVG